MYVYKCKMCGGTIEFEDGKTVVTCEYCNTTQTLPRLDDDRKTNLYDRANHFRRNNEYDKAMSIYEQILNEDNTDAESYWSIVLCRYGIEYVEDPTTHKRVPTVNRAQFTSVLADEDYKKALEYADIEQKIIYEAEAHAIDEIQKGILEISNKEEPFDVFICYKETDSNGRRTQDSVLATDLYHQLIQEGFKVFFSRITLEDKIGTAYEPYIFAALNSAKVMVVLGTKPEYYNAVWVKNEWSRYLSLVKNSNGKKILIPAYRDMDPYDLPEEFSHLQAQDMSKLGFMQDLIRGIKKIANADEPKPVVKETVLVGGNVNTAPLLKRAFICLEDGEWEKADEFCEQVLNQDPENSQAYIGKLLVELHIRRQEELVDCDTLFDDSKNYRNAVRFGDETTKSLLKGYIDQINERNENKRLTEIYNKAVSAMQVAKTEDEFKSAMRLFESISGFEDSNELKVHCVDKAEECRLEYAYTFAREQMKGENISNYENAIKAFEYIIEYKDSKEQISICRQIIDEIKANEQKNQVERDKKARRIKIVTPIIVVCIILTIVIVKFIIPKAKYNKAMSLIDAGDYNRAYSLLVDIGYNESNASGFDDRVRALLESGEYEFAYNLLLISKKWDMLRELNSTEFSQMLIDIHINEGDIIHFGNYNGETEWRVLDVRDNSVLIISLNCVDEQRFSHDSNSWSTSSVREWLNDDYYNTAFNSNEQSMIHDEGYGNVFLLSDDEVQLYFDSVSDRIAKYQGYSEEWWLRTPFTLETRNEVYYSENVVSTEGGIISLNISDERGVRPAIWISLDS